MTTRRRFLSQVMAGSAAVAAPSWLPRELLSVAYAETQLGHVQFSSDIEPTVRILETTPRDRLLEEVAVRIKRGQLSYRQVVAALMLAGIRNVQPRPSVGFKFHTVLVVNSAHLASINSPAEERWLPIFWALDYFKYAQADEAERSSWTMPAADESQLPPLRQARQEFVSAMDAWDPEKADAAIATWARGASENELFEHMARYGCRDFRDIGHKAIFVANAFRTLGCIGWQHAEPVLRSLTFALQCRGGDPNPASHDLSADRPERDNLEWVDKAPPAWWAGRVDADATRRLSQLLHDCEPHSAAQAAYRELEAGVSPRSVYDAFYLCAGELLMRQPGIIALHAVTMTNALGYAFRRVSDTRLRLKILLQNASFLAMFWQRMKRDRVADKWVAKIMAAESPADRDSQVATIMQHVGRDNDLAAGQVLGLLNRDPAAANRLFHAARRMVFLKGTNSHDYKYSSAVLEDYFHISPPWRNYYAAAAVYKLRGSQENDTDLLPRIREALA